MDMEQQCPVCGLQAEVGDNSGSAFRVNCVRCGQFRAMLEFAEDFGQERRFTEVRHLVSGALREATVAKQQLPPVSFEIVEQSLLPLGARGANRAALRSLTT